MLQPVIHPWYLIPGLGLSLMTGKKSFLVWSFAVIFSYQAYGNPNFEESSFYLVLEYALLLRQKIFLKSRLKHMGDGMLGIK